MKEFAGVAMPAGQRVQNNPPGKSNKRNGKRRRSG